MSDLANISLFGTGHTCAGPWCQHGWPLGSKIDFYNLGAYGLASPHKREIGDLFLYWPYTMSELANISIFWDGPYMGWPLVPIWQSPGVQNWFLHLGGIWTCITLQERKMWVISILAIFHVKFGHYFNFCYGGHVQWTVTPTHILVSTLLMALFTSVLYGFVGHMWENWFSDVARRE